MSLVQSTCRLRCVRYWNSLYVTDVTCASNEWVCHSVMNLLNKLHIGLLVSDCSSHGVGNLYMGIGTLRDLALIEPFFCHNVKHCAFTASVFMSCCWLLICFVNYGRITWRATMDPDFIYFKWWYHGSCRCRLFLSNLTAGTMEVVATPKRTHHRYLGRCVGAVCVHISINTKKEVPMCWM